MNKTAYVLLILFGATIYLLCILKWFEDEYIYELNLNNWLCVRYSYSNYTEPDKYVDVYLFNNSTATVAKRVKLDKKNWHYKSQLVDNCIDIVYNEDFLLAKTAKYNYSRDSNASSLYNYYKITPINTAEEGYNRPKYNTDTITLDEYNKLKLKHPDNKELDAMKIREINKELNNQDKTISDVTKLIFLIILCIIFYAYYL